MENSSINIEKIIKQYKRRLFNLAFQMIGDIHTAEEVLQDAFLIIHQKIDEFRGESDIYTWIYRITANLCFKAKSRLNRERIRQQNLEFEYMLNNGIFKKSSEIEDLKNNPEKELLYQELLVDVRTECHYIMLGFLTKGQRIVFLFRTRFQLSFAEIAKILMISENAAKSRMNRAVKTIENDLFTKCSVHNSEGKCNCENWAYYTVYKHPAILKDLPISKIFIDEIRDVFETSDMGTLFQMLPEKQWPMLP
jgi:RNA polymerase sigma-70 factor, ECF subfamily